MLNLLREFTELHLTGADGIPHRLALYLGATEIVLGDGPTVFPLTLITPSSFAPANGVVGTQFVYQTPLFNGSGPITLSTIFRIGSSLINPATGQVTQEETEATIIGSGPFYITPEIAGQIRAQTSAVGADDVVVYDSERVSTVTVPAPPSFTQEPSLLPNPAIAGELININPGDGPNLSWTLTYNNVQVANQVTNLQYRPPANTTGTLRISSTVTNAGGSVTRIVEIQVNAAGTVTPQPVMMINPGDDGFTVTNAGPSPAASNINVNEDGFTVQPN